MRFAPSGDKHCRVIRSFESKEIGAAGARPVAYPEGIVNPPCSLDSRSMVWHPRCSGWRTITRGLAHTGFCRPALGANTRLRSKPRQHLCYVYASLSRLGFRGLPEKFIVVFEGFISFPAAKKPTALMMHWWN